jgi:alpha-tubulin suppressor-like RCC1 family protein
MVPVVHASGADPALVDLSVGGLFGCAIDGGDGYIRCWGRGENGQMGNGSWDYINKKASVVSSLTGATDISLGQHHGCAIVEMGDPGEIELYCWGRNTDGQLGDGNSGQSYLAVVEPVLVSTGQEPASLSAGGYHTCMLTEECCDGTGQVWCWGANGVGQLASPLSGLTPTEAWLTPAGPQINDVDLLAAGDAHTCAGRTGSKYLRCWGSNASGQLGGGGATGPLQTNLYGVTVQMADVQGNLLHLTAGWDHTCLSTDAGTIYCWGEGGDGRLGDGGESLSAVPKVVSFLAPEADGEVVIQALAAGNAHTCAVGTGFKGDPEQQVYCWGNNDYGQIGDGTKWDFVPHPVVIPF